MRLTVVGCGYVGLAVARQWRERGDCHLTLTTTSAERQEELEALADRVVVTSADCATGLSAALEGSDAAVFCLGPKGNRQVDAAGYRQTFLDSFSCLQKQLAGLPQLKHIVYTSSCSVYGNANGGWIDEATPAEPCSEHGTVLLEAERQLQAMENPQRRICILRLAALYGPQREFETRFSRLAGTTQQGDGQRFTNWLHRDDAAGAVVSALGGHWSGVINVVDDEPVRLADLLNATLQNAGLAAIRWVGSDDGREQGNNRRISNSRLHDHGYQLRHPRIALLNGTGELQRVAASKAGPPSPQR